MLRRYTAAKRFCAAMITFMLLLLLLPALHASAEAHGNFYIPDGAVPAGDEFIVSVEFTASDSIGTVQAAVSYDENHISFVSCDFANGGGGIINIQGFPGSDTTVMTVDITFRALREGTSDINLTNGSVMSMDGRSLSNSISAYATITIGSSANTNNSDNSENSGGYDPDDNYSDEYRAQLRSLTIPTGELKPEFSPGIYDYTVTVAHDVDYFEPVGVTGQENDLIWYEGTNYLSDGYNYLTITVTSADGLTSNVYTITVFRESDEEEIGVEEEEETEYYEEPEADDELEESSIVVTKLTVADPSSKADEGKTGMDDLRDSLMPALYVAMAVLILAVVILIFWIRSKTKNKLK